MALIKLNSNSYSSVENLLGSNGLIQTKHYLIATTNQTSTSTSFVDIGSAFNFTPLSTNSILIVNISTDMKHDDGYGQNIRLLKDGTAVTPIGSSNSWLFYRDDNGTANNHTASSFFIKLANSSTSQITFKLQQKVFNTGEVAVGNWGNTEVVIQEIAQ